MKRTLKSGQRSARDIDVILTHASLSASLSTAGVTEGTYKVTAKVAATGVYTIAINDAFARAPRVIAIPLVSGTAAGSMVTAKIVSRTTSQIVIQTFLHDGTQIACTELHVAIRGYDCLDQN